MYNPFHPRQYFRDGIITMTRQLIPVYYIEKVIFWRWYSYDEQAILYWYRYDDKGNNLCILFIITMKKALVLKYLHVRLKGNTLEMAQLR